MSFKLLIVIINLQNNSGVKALLSLHCNEMFFGPRCSVHCDPMQYPGSFTCDPQTGELACKPGWTGSQCTEKGTYAIWLIIDQVFRLKRRIRCSSFWSQTSHTTHMVITNEIGLAELTRESLFFNDCIN